MKVRNGFVSNSSSSSFIIRGCSFEIISFCKELINNKTIPDPGFTDGDWDDHEQVSELFWGISSLLQKNGLALEEDRYFFDTEDTPVESIIIGKTIAGLDDGQVSALPNPTVEGDNDIKSSIEKLGVKVTQEIKTYVQYVSNDNF